MWGGGGGGGAWWTPLAHGLYSCPSECRQGNMASWVQQRCICLVGIHPISKCVWLWFHLYKQQHCGCCFALSELVLQHQHYDKLRNKMLEQQRRYTYWADTYKRSRNKHFNQEWRLHCALVSLHGGGNTSGWSCCWWPLGWRVTYLCC